VLAAFSFSALHHLTVTHFDKQLAVSAFTLLVGRQNWNPTCKKLDRWGAGVVTCLEPRADLHMAQLMSLPLTVSCVSKIQIAFNLSGTGSTR